MAAKIRLDSAGNVLGMGKLMGLELNKYLFFTCPMVVEHEVENEQKNKDSQPDDDPVSFHVFILCVAAYNSRDESLSWSGDIKPIKPAPRDKCPVCGMFGVGEALASRNQGD